MNPLEYQLHRAVIIHASPATVFRFFTDSARWARWWGEGSTIEARAGGRVYIRHPGGVETAGEVLEIRAPERIVFTYGFVSGKPIPPGSSKVTIRIEPHPEGTRLHLVHEFPEPGVRDEHVQGWRFQLALFGNVASEDAFAGSAPLADAWFEAWTIPGDEARLAAFASITTPDVTFRDRHSLLEGAGDLSAHAAAAQRFRPGIRMRRTGEVRHCQGMLLVDWSAAGADGAECVKGTNVYVLSPDGRIASATGFVSPSANS